MIGTALHRPVEPLPFGFCRCHSHAGTGGARSRWMAAMMRVKRSPLTATSARWKVMARAWRTPQTRHRWSGCRSIQDRRLTFEPRGSALRPDPPRCRRSSAGPLRCSRREMPRDHGRRRGGAQRRQHRHVRQENRPTFRRVRGSGRPVPRGSRSEALADGGSDQSNAFPLAARKVTGAFPVDRPSVPAEPSHEHPRLTAGRKSEPCVCDQSSKHPLDPPTRRSSDGTREASGRGCIG